jgi:hypothetical protein
MQPPHQPHGPPPAPPQVSVGGPQGIQIQGTQVYVQGQPIARGTPVAAQPAVQPESSTQHLIRSLTITGAAAFVAPVLLVIMLGVSPVILPLAAGAGAAALGLAHWIRRKSVKALTANVEHELMSLAAHQGGELTVPVAAHHLRVPLEQADACLMDLARAGHVEIHNDEASGAVLYRFPDIWANPSRYQALKGATHD